MAPKINKKIVITSGYWNPLHVGHINLLREAKKLGDYLIVIVNNDEQVKIKGSMFFMEEKERVEIIKSLKYVDEAVLSIDKDATVAESLIAVAKKYPGAEFLFAKGGDRDSGNIPEKEKKVCKDFNIKIISGVGGEKVQGSSWLLKKVNEK